LPQLTQPQIVRRNACWHHRRSNCFDSQYSSLNSSNCFDSQYSWLSSSNCFVKQHNWLNRKKMRGAIALPHLSRIPKRPTRTQVHCPLDDLIFTLATYRIVRRMGRSQSMRRYWAPEDAPKSKVRMDARLCGMSSAPESGEFLPSHEIVSSSPPPAAARAATPQPPL
jgi:hypothetical protein